MTRINCVPPSELSREHLVAEYRELPRIFKSAAYAWAWGFTKADSLPTYRLGEGHLKFFWDKLGYCAQRHRALVKEMQRRGYVTNITNPDRRWVDDMPPEAWGMWEPTEAAMVLNRARLRLRETA